jgi:hypothetical protein
VRHLPADSDPPCPLRVVAMIELGVVESGRWNAWTAFCWSRVIDSVVPRRWLPAQ